MSRTITALFDSRTDAEAGRQRLLDANLDTDNVKIHDKSSIGTTGYSSPSEPGMWASIKNAFLPNEDRHVYEEGVRRGGFLLVADVDDDKIDEAIRVLEEGHNTSVDIHQRASQWKSEGWTPPVSTAGAAPATGERDTLVNGGAGSETRIPVIEEQLIVGKREVERGGVRVRSYVTETPVHEQVQLREERINIERRPVDRPVGEDVFREQSMEVRATAEEAVVEKSARVVEEVTIGKQVSQRQEQIADTVRHTEVDVQRIGAATNTSALADDDSYFRNHFQSNYAANGGSYDSYAPAYGFGSQMGTDPRFRGRQWNDVEGDLRSDWESRNAGSGSTWETMKAAVRHGWDRMTNGDGARLP
jgi:uncharacterized protein (TIGR02271 family)